MNSTGASVHLPDGPSVWDSRAVAILQYDRARRTSRRQLSNSTAGPGQRARNSHWHRTPFTCHSTVA